MSLRTSRSRHLAGILLSIAWMGCGPQEEPLDVPELGQTKQGLTVAYGLVSEPGTVDEKGQAVQHFVNLTHGGSCILETTLSSLYDSTLTLTDQSGNQLAFDDDGGPGLGSRVAVVLLPGVYNAYVRSYDPALIGSYSLSVSCSPVVNFHHKFYGDGDLWQCFRWAYDHIQAGIGEWTAPIHMDMDSRTGGCYQQFGITDPTNLLAGLQLTVNVFGDGDTTQCLLPSTGPWSIPIATTPSTLNWSPAYRFDTDNRHGGCRQVFTLEGRSDLVLDVDFQPTDWTNAHQCGNPGTHTVEPGMPLSILVNTDNTGGACSQRFRLRRR